MRALVVLAIAVACVAAGVLNLDSTNFQTSLKENKLMLIEFYAPWCGHCKKLAPEYEKAAAELDGAGLTLAAINADEEENRQYASQFGIRGFPTLKLFRDGEFAKDYEGDRTAEAIVAFMKKQSRPAVVTFTTVDEVEQFVKSDRVVVVGFFDQASGAQYEAFKATANTYRDSFSFAEVIGHSSIATHFGAASSNVVLFKQFDEGKSVFTGDFADLPNFVAAQSVPVIDEIGPQNYKNYMESGLPLAYIFAEVDKKDVLVNGLYDLAKSSKGKLNWVWIDFTKYARHGERLGLSGKISPAVAIENPANGKHWAFDETATVTVEAVTAWIDKFLAGDLPETVRSEEIPPSQEGPVHKLVAKNFDQVVGDKSKNVFVMFYAPWCGHCKALHPTFDELAKEFADDSSVIVAHIDATANDVNPAFNIRGFPTLKFFAAGEDKTPVDYNGDRSLNDMKIFISTHKAGGAANSGKDEL